MKRRGAAMVSAHVALLSLAWFSVASAETFEAFSEPVQTIRLSAAHPGRVDRVMVKRGDRVAADSLIMQLDSNVLEASRMIAKQEAESTTQIESLEIEYEMKQNRHAQVAGLLERGAVSPEEAKRAEADARIAKLALVAAIEKKSLAQLKLAELDGRLEQQRVRGQVAGLVIDVLREPGEYVSTSDPHVATVVVLAQLRCTFFVPTEVADLYEEGETIDMMMEQNSGSGDRPVRARVVYIAAVTQADSGRVRVDMIIENSAQQFRSGLRCRLEPQRRQPRLQWSQRQTSESSL
ncbi:efflux RND transporter periplasmic adaptor subunit [Novipirellula artificiosorum]|nr:HlyD family efflux transporter periplasmic adaptor subunit [Novipirellula artificiosorum]